jgi:acyl-ACP thioesterase
VKEFSRRYYLSAGECNPQAELPMPLLLTRIIDIATHHANAWGVGYAHLISNRRAWVLSRVTVEMMRWPRVDEDYTVITWIEDYNNHFSQRVFEVQDGEGQPIGYARTIWMVIDLDKRTGVDITSLSYIRENVHDRPCPIEPQSRLRPMTEGRDVDHTFGYVECDFNRHVNTVRYLELIMNQLDLSYYDNHWLRRLEMAFVKETHYGEQATLRIVEQAPDDWRINIMADGADHVRTRLVFEKR